MDSIGIIVCTTSCVGFVTYVEVDIILIPQRMSRPSIVSKKEKRNVLIYPKPHTFNKKEKICHSRTVGFFRIFSSIAGQDAPSSCLWCPADACFWVTSNSFPDGFWRRQHWPNDWDEPSGLLVPCCCCLLLATAVRTSWNPCTREQLLAARHASFVSLPN